MRTPAWNKADLELCAKYDKKVKQGKMRYRTISVY